MAKTIFVLPFLIFFGVITYFTIPILKKSDPKLLPSALVDKDVPEKKLPPLFKNKRGFDHEDLVGTETLVNFFSSWCGPCRVEHDILMKISEEKLLGSSV